MNTIFVVDLIVSNNYDGCSQAVIKIDHGLFVMLKKEQKSFLAHLNTSSELYKHSFWDDTPDFYEHLNNREDLGCDSVLEITEEQMQKLISNQDVSRMSGCVLCIRNTGFSWRASKKYVSETIETEEISWKRIGL